MSARTCAEDEDCLGVDRGGVHGNVGTGAPAPLSGAPLEIHLKGGATGDCDGDHGEDFHRRVVADADVAGAATWAESGMPRRPRSKALEETWVPCGRAIGLRSENGRTRSSL